MERIVQLTDYEYKRLKEQAEATQAHKEIDWEARRYEIAKSAMNGILASASMYGGCHQSSFEVSNMAIYYADALIAELKKGGAQ